MSKRSGSIKTGLAILALLGLALASCVKPPAGDYDSGGSAVVPSAGLPVGQNTASESCTAQSSSGSADIYCGTWDQPSAPCANRRPGLARRSHGPGLDQQLAGIFGSFLCLPAAEPDHHSGWRAGGNIILHAALRRLAACRLWSA